MPKLTYYDALGEPMEAEFTEAEIIAGRKGWSLHRQYPTNRGLTAYEFRSTPVGDWQKTINSDSELAAAKALPKRR